MEGRSSASVSTKQFKLGIIVGKFWPPHKGHELLVQTGVSQCDELVAVVCVRPFEKPGRERASWLQSNCPGAVVKIFDQLEELDNDDSDLWAGIAKSFIDGRTPDACFSSESYGETFAKALGPKVVDVRVDQPRQKVPVSGTKCRADPFGSWSYLSLNVRQYYSKLVVMVGAESTGKSTLTLNLTKHFNRYHPIAIEEYGRVVSERKQDPRAGFTEQEFNEIAQMQTNMIQKAMGKSFLVFADTDARATPLWQQLLNGKTTNTLQQIANKAHVPDLFILCPVQGAQFVQDGTREDGQHRIQMENDLRTICTRTGAKIVEINSDNWQARTKQAIQAVQDILPNQ